METKRRHERVLDELLLEYCVSPESQRVGLFSLDNERGRSRVLLYLADAIMGGLAMRKDLLLASALFAALSSSAFAADLPTTKGPPVYMPPPPVWTWTGFYGGIVGGGGWGRARQWDAGGFNSGGYNLGGGIIGGTLGYNWQVNNFVLGLEGDGSGAWIRGSTPGTIVGCGGLTARCSSDLEALGTVRGRVGVMFDRFLPYITGGAAIGSLHGSEGDVPLGGAFGSGSSTVVGWTVGAGVEAKITPEWSAKIEYLHVDLGDHAIFNDTIAGAPVPQNIRYTSEIVRAGLNYHFDLFALPAPVAAKY